MSWNRTVPDNLEKNALNPCTLSSLMSQNVCVCVCALPVKMMYHYLSPTLPRTREFPSEKVLVLDKFHECPARKNVEKFKINVHRHRNYNAPFRSDSFLFLLLLPNHRRRCRRLVHRPKVTSRHAEIPHLSLDFPLTQQHGNGENKIKTYVYF